MTGLHRALHSGFTAFLIIYLILLRRNRTHLKFDPMDFNIQLPLWWVKHPMEIAAKTALTALIQIHGLRYTALTS